MDVSEDLQKAERDLGDESRNWHMDDRQLKSDDEAVVGVWKKRRKGERMQGKDEGDARSSNTSDG